MLSKLTDTLKALDPRLVQIIEKITRRLPVEDALKKIPAVRRALDQQYDELLASVADSLRPYRQETTTHTAIPSGRPGNEAALSVVRDLAAREVTRWRDGYVSGGVYQGDSEHTAMLAEVYRLFAHANPLHSDLWPSINKFEAEVIAMCADLMGKTQSGAPISGAMTSGGTESILLAMKAYRDLALKERGVRRPELLAPATAHAAFDKACQYFGIKRVVTPADASGAVDLKRLHRHINRNTIVVVGSAPNFPHGLIDPIAEMSALALERGVPFHTDACLGGFVLPFARHLGHAVPAFDFALPGVTSISIDTHKYGYAAKGTSVILYRTPALRAYQYFTIADWPGGLYFSPGFAGSRPGALIAQAWASLIALGQEGFVDTTAKILNTAAEIKAGLAQIPELQVIGDPLWVIAMRSEVVDIYAVMDYMSKKQWSLNGLHRPAAIHLAVTPLHAQPGVAARFLDDLKAAVAYVREHPRGPGGAAPIYGLAGVIPAGGVVQDILKKYIDALYKV